MNLCHIEVVTSEMDVPLSELELSRVLEPDNPKEIATQWLYITVIQKMGYITKPFRSLVLYSRVLLPAVVFRGLLDFDRFSNYERFNNFHFPYNKNT